MKERSQEQQLVSAARGGDLDAFEALVRLYEKRVFALTLRMCGNPEDAAEAAQETFLAAWQGLAFFRGDASFSTFAELCVSRQMYSAIEASKRKKHFPLNTYVSLYEESEVEKDGRTMPLIDTIEPERENDPEALYFGKEYTEAFVEQLKEMLSPLENHVLYLHLMGTDYKKIAEILEKSPKSIDNAIQRIRGKAEKMLRRHDR